MLCGGTYRGVVYLAARGILYRYLHTHSLIHNMYGEQFSSSKRG